MRAARVPAPHVNVEGILRPRSAVALGVGCLVNHIWIVFIYAPLRLGGHVVVDAVLTNWADAHLYRRPRITQVGIARVLPLAVEMRLIAVRADLPPALPEQLPQS